MSRIRKLSLRGIRNFGDEQDEASIYFTKPLTLILGPNGTGKTTIIEALKYATTSEFPPDSDKGKSFVHEPKLTRQHSVRGHVKAEVIDKNGEILVVCRTMQITQNQRGGAQFKTLDNVLTRVDKNNKEKQMVSSRCMDISVELIAAMGVSKPILNYVVFCHQEESNWPLDDGKKLKDRFDEIFDTSKFNKALDSTTKYIKELSSEVNTLKAQSEGLEMMVQEVKKKESSLANLKTRENTTKTRINEINLQLIPVNSRMQEIQNLKKTYDKVYGNLEKKEMEYSIAKRQIENLRGNIKELHTGTEAELLEKIESYNEMLKMKVDNTDKLEELLKKTEKEGNDLAKKLSDHRVNMGILKQQKVQRETQITKRNNILRDALRDWNIKIEDTQLSEEEVSNLTHKLNKKIDEFKTTVETRSHEHEQEEKHMQRDVDTFRSKKSGTESEISVKTKEMSAISKEISDIRAEISLTGAAAEKLDSIETKLTNANKTYETIKAKVDVEAVECLIEGETENRNKLQESLNKIDKEIMLLHQRSKQHAEIEVHQKKLIETQNHIAKMRKKHGNNLLVLFEGKDISKRNLKENVDKIQISLAANISDLNSKIDKEQRCMTRLETTLKYQEKEFAKKLDELEKNKDKVSKFCLYSNYDETVQLQSMKINRLQDKRGMYAHQSVSYKEYLKAIDQKSCCPLCDRGFTNTSDAEKLSRKLLTEMELNPKMLLQCEEELREEQRIYNELLQLKPIVDKIIYIEKEESSRLMETVNSTKNSLLESQQNLTKLKKLLTQPETRLNICKNMIGDIALWDQYIDEEDKINKALEQIKSQIPRTGQTRDRSIQEAQDERQSLQDLLKETNSKIDDLQQNLKTDMDKVYTAQNTMLKLQEQVLKIRTDMQNVKQLKDTLSDLYSREARLDESVESLREVLVTIEHQLSKAVQDLKKTKENNRHSQMKDRETMSKSNQKMYELSSINSEVEKCAKSNIDERLKIAKVELETDTEKSKEVTSKKDKLEKKLRECREQVSLQEMGKRDLVDNLSLMKTQCEADRLKEQCTELENAVKNMCHKDLMEEYRNLQTEEENLHKQMNMAKGNRDELERCIKELQDDLLQEKCRMARRNYRNKQLELVVQKHAIDNLKAYIKVLDMAMIQFHEERMGTVNKIMERMWNLVYTGTDTSSIQIRVDSTEGIGDRKRSYNYKLVQIKHGVEMDMKGRCSAGQKVLASIIIRMALAETFCNECAVLALDEPTTNLDEEHAKNLGEALSNVVQLRSQYHKNFQLIIISHDEKFLTSLSRLNRNQGFHELYRNDRGLTEVRYRDLMNPSAPISQSMSAHLDSDEEDNTEIFARNNRSEF